MKYLCSCALIMLLCSMAFSAPLRPLRLAPVEEPTSVLHDKTGALLGVESGVSLIRGNSSDKLVADVGAKFGYNFFFNQFFGVRLYGSGNVIVEELGSALRRAEYPTYVYSQGSMIFLFNADMLYDFYNEKNLSLGVIFGAHAGYEFNPYNEFVAPIGEARYNYTQSGFRAGLNAGFSMLFHGMHRIDILYRYVILQPPQHEIIFTNTTAIYNEYPTSSPFGFFIGYTLNL